MDVPETFQDLSRIREENPNICSRCSPSEPKVFSEVAMSELRLFSGKKQSISDVMCPLSSIQTYALEVWYTFRNNQKFPLISLDSR